MRKFLIPIINLVNVILVTIAFVLGNTSAATTSYSGTSSDLPRYYHLIWNAADKTNVLGIVGFFVLIFAAVLMLINFIPFKGRKCVAGVAGAAFIAAGVLILKTPAAADLGPVVLGSLELSGALIAMAVLVIIAGALSLVMTVLDLTAKEAK